MSHFEYVSVAAALIFALVIGRLVGGIPAAMKQERFYWVQAVWILVMLLVSVFQWWGAWRMRGIDWTPVRFLWLLLMPGILLIRSIILVGVNPDAITSFRQHFFRIRIPFFALGLASGAHLIVAPWISGTIPWLVLAPAHRQAAVVSVVSIIGLAFRHERVQQVLVVASLISVATGFVILPIVG